MKKLWIKIFGMLICWEYVTANSEDDFYTAAVVEFPLPTTPHSAVTNVESMIVETLDEYTRLINEAAESGADILAFPEGCLNYVGIATRSLLIKHAVELNDNDLRNSTDFNGEPCDYAEKSPIIHKVSLKSRENRIYVLINVIERVKSSPLSSKASNKYDLYSSNIVFDRHGCIISRYRKYNTEFDPLLNRTKVPEVQIFHTDFGVTFGHFTSLDILAKYPSFIMLQYGIEHFINPTLWYSSTPFYSSLQVQQGYSYSNNIVMLAAGANNLASGQGGSGIYIGNSGPMVMYQPGERLQQLMLAKVPKKLNAYSIQLDTASNLVKRYTLKEIDQLLVTLVPLTTTHPLIANKVKKICSKKVCCEFFVKYSSKDIPNDKFGYSYRFSIFNGLVDSTEGSHCAIVSCTKESENKCGLRFFPSDNLVPSVRFSEIRISMTIELSEEHEEDLMVMPSSVDFHLLPLPVDKFGYAATNIYNVSGKQYRKYTTALLSESDTLLTFGLLGRSFQLTELDAIDDFDDEYDIAGYSSYLLLTSISMGLVLLFIIWKLFRIK